MPFAKILQTRLGIYSAIAASVVAISGAMAGAWNIADKLEIRPALKSELHLVEDAQQQTVKTLALFRFQYLLERLRQNRILSDQETAELCELAHQLNYVKIDICRN